MIEDKLDTIIGTVLSIKEDLIADRTLTPAPKKRVPLYKNEAAIAAMVRTISRENVERLQKKLTKKQLYHTEMVAAKRRREFVDFEAALKDPQIIELIKTVQKVSPGWQPKFHVMT